jgi:hypothetical protein
MTGLSKFLMRENNSSPMTEEQKSAQAALEDIRSRGASGERIAQSTLRDAIRRAAAADLDAQWTKRWERT